MFIWCTMKSVNDKYIKVNQRNVSYLIYVSSKWMNQSLRNTTTVCNIHTVATPSKLILAVTKTQRTYRILKIHPTYSPDANTWPNTWCKFYNNHTPHVVLLQNPPALQESLYRLYNHNLSLLTFLCLKPLPTTCTYFRTYNNWNLTCRIKINY